MNQKTLSNLILIAYALMMIVSLVSAVDLFAISHPTLMFGWMMSVAIEISIAALLMINRSDAKIKSALYVLGFITLFQICANTYSAYIHITDIKPFAELFALDEWEIIDQKRVLAFATGGLLPAICLSLIYIQSEVRSNLEKKDDSKETTDPEPEQQEPITESEEDAVTDETAPDETVDEPEQQETPEGDPEPEQVENQPDTTEHPEESPVSVSENDTDDTSNEVLEETPIVEEPQEVVEEKPKKKATKAKKTTTKKKEKTTKDKDKKAKSTKKTTKSTKAKKPKKAATDIPEVGETAAAESVETLVNKHKPSGPSTINSFTSMF